MVRRADRNRRVEWDKRVNLERVANTGGEGKCRLSDGAYVALIPDKDAADESVESGLSEEVIVSET